jgi:hypothetical protein
LEVGDDLNNAVISLSYDLLNSSKLYFMKKKLKLTYYVGLIEVSGELGDIGSIMKFKAKHFNLFSCIGNMERMVLQSLFIIWY